MRISLLKRLPGHYALLIVAGILSIGLGLIGCQKKGPDTTTVNAPIQSGTGSSAATITPTAQSVLVEKMKNKEALDVNDQVALHMMKPEDRRKLMEELNKSKK